MSIRDITNDTASRDAEAGITDEGLLEALALFNGLSPEGQEDTLRQIHELVAATGRAA